MHFSINKHRNIARTCMIELFMNDLTTTFNLRD